MTSTSDRALVLAVVKQVETLTRTISSMEASLTRDLVRRVKEKLQVKTRQGKLRYSHELHEAAREHRRILVEALEDFSAGRKNMVHFMQAVENGVDLEELFQRVFGLTDEDVAGAGADAYEPSHGDGSSCLYLTSGDGDVAAETTLDEETFSGAQVN